MPKNKRSRKREPRTATIREKIDDKISGKTLAALFDLTLRRIQQLADSGTLKRHSHGHYFTAGAGAAITKLLVQNEMAKLEQQAAPSKVDYDVERARHMRLKNDQAEHILIETADAIALVDWVFGKVWSELQGLPAAITDDVAERRRIEHVIDQRFATLATEFGEAREHTRTGGDVSDPAFADVARRVGATQ